MKSNIFKKAHKLTKDIIKKGDNYRATFKLCLSFVYSQLKKGVNKMVELKGTEKQIKWAEDIRMKFIELCDKYELVLIKERYEDMENADAWINNRNCLLNNEEKLIEVEMNQILRNCNQIENPRTWFKDFPEEADRWDRLDEILCNF